MFWAEYLKTIDMKESDAINILGVEYVKKNGVLRQKKLCEYSQEQTKEAFAYKWAKRDTYESEPVRKATYEWLLNKYFCGNNDRIKEYIKDGIRMLDAGCGSGFSASVIFRDYFNKINYLGMDISTAVDVAQQRFDELGLKGEFLQSDLLNIPFDKPVFDVIFSEGVLHHTKSVEESIKYLSRFIVKDGYFMFYVYAKKGPIREFCDDYIRETLEDLTDQEAWNALLPLTKLGRVLGDLNQEIDIPEAIPLLGIPAGRINIQRLFYWYIFKAYHRPDYTIDEMNHINFDWYRPLNCHRHTPEEIANWCNEAGLTIENMKVEEAGISVIARKAE